MTPDTADHPDTRDDIARALDAFARAIRELSAQDATGDLAALKRLDWRRPDALAFARLTIAAPVSGLIEAAPDPRALLSRLAAIASVMAAASELHAGWRLGRALAEAGATPQRLGALLTARGEALIETLRRTAARLGREAPLPYRQLGKLLIADLIDPRAAEDLRFAIAQDFARAGASRNRANAPGPAVADAPSHQTA